MTDTDCTRCGRPDGSPIQDGAGRLTGARLCCTCWNADVLERRRGRRAELDALPRCEVPSCSRRGTWECGAAPAVLLCGWHRNAATRELGRRLAPVAGLAMFGAPAPTGPDVLALVCGARSESRESGEAMSEVLVNIPGTTTAELVSCPHAGADHAPDCRVCGGTGWTVDRVTFMPHGSSAGHFGPAAEVTAAADYLGGGNAPGALEAAADALDLEDTGGPFWTAVQRYLARGVPMPHELGCSLDVDAVIGWVE